MPQDRVHSFFFLSVKKAGENPRLSKIIKNPRKIESIFGYNESVFNIGEDSSYSIAEVGDSGDDD